jgi:hypothetical protein
MNPGSPGYGLSGLSFPSTRSVSIAATAVVTEYVELGARDRGAGHRRRTRKPRDQRRPAPSSRTPSDRLRIPTAQVPAIVFGLGQSSSSFSSASNGS